MNGWIGVDLDGTLAVYNGWTDGCPIGAPVPEMVERVKRWIADGKEIRIFTARVFSNIGDEKRQREAAEQLANITAWCLTNIGHKLEVTCVKDYNMDELWDDRCVRVEKNTGKPLCESPRGFV